MYLTLLLSFLVSNVFALDEESCPSPSLKIEFVSPVTKNKIQSCAYQKEGMTIKHGPELTFDSSGKVVKSKFFNHGLEGAAVNQPGAEEEKKQDVNNLALNDLMDILRVLSFQRTEVTNNFFNVSRCDKDAKVWMMGALTNGPINRDYNFTEGCDVKGSFVASFKEEFPVSFDLRNLKEFTKAIMKVKMQISKAGGTYKYRYEITEGTVTSKDHNVGFVAYSEMELDPMTMRFVPETQNGKISLKRVNGQTTDLSRPFKY